MSIRILFMGTPEFAVPCLKMLIDEGYEVVKVVTQPDKPKGRGNKLSAPPVKEFAESKGIGVLQPDKIKTPEFVALIKDINPELIVTVAYGKILPQNMLDIPPMGCINVHGSILPKYRGAAPIQWSVINGEKETGITTMYTDAGMDTGDMLLKRHVEIPQDMTAGELHDKLSIIGAEVLKETLLELSAGKLIRTPQDNNEATYVPMISKDTGRIDWNKTPQEINNLVRGTNPWPGAFTYYEGQRMRVWKTAVSGKSEEAFKPGKILKVDKTGILVAAGSGLIRITEIQFDSGRKMRVEEYIVGHKLNEGEILG